MTIFNRVLIEISIQCTRQRGTGKPKLEKFPDSDKKIVKLKIKEARNMNKNVKFCKLKLNLFCKTNNIIIH